MSISPRIIALHGFLGRPDDFAPLELSHVVAPNIFHIAPGPIDGWIARFLRGCRHGDVLLGYSMGGRLALQCLIASPNTFKAAIILAAHPGLPLLSQRAARRQNDAQWAHLFSTAPWDKLMIKWNQQPALLSSKPVVRHAHEFSRSALAGYLRYASLGAQDLLLSKLSELTVPILWLSPKSEAAHLRRLSCRHPHSQIHFIPHGGHRFLFEYPRETSRYIRDFLRSLPN